MALYMKRCPASPVIREMQVKTKVRYHFTATRMTIIKTKVVLVRMERNWSPNTLLVRTYLK